MKIGIDARLWNETGVGRYIRNLVWQLQKIDKENEYVLFVKSSEGVTIPASKWKVVTTDIHWHTIDEQVRFHGILEKENLNLVHFPYFSVPVFYNRPYVVTIHDLIIYNFSTGKASTLPFPLYQLKRVGYKYILSQAVKNAVKVIVPLTTVKEDVIKTFNVPENKVVVTTEGVDEGINLQVKNHSIRQTQDAMSKIQVNSQKYFLYVGNAYPHKNLERLIDAFKEFLLEKKEVKLVLVGKEDYFYKRLKEKVTEMGIGDAIIFAGSVTDEELTQFYSHAIALVSPSLMEGFGLPPLEAMASHSLVLLSDIPAFREVCLDVAFYFDPNSVEDIKEKLHFVYNLDHTTRQKHSEKGIQRVKEFSWKSMAEQTLKLYESSSGLR